MTPHRPMPRWSWLTAALAAGLVASLAAQGKPAQPDWTAVEPEALGHYQSLIRFDTSATERAEADYLKQLFDAHGIRRRCWPRIRSGPTWWRGSRATAASARSCCLVISTP